MTISISWIDISEWPKGIKEVSIVSSADKSTQPALIFNPGKDEARPLLVALHTWSNDYKQSGSIPYAEWCIDKDWIFIHPNFRGANKKPEATGSPLAMQDIYDAVQFVLNEYSVDTTRIYLVGNSGGGMAALLAASYYPELWTAVSAWSSISDLTAWYEEGVQDSTNYPEMIRLSCMGSPGESEAVDQEYRIRSPLTHLEKAKGVILDINAGIADGHTGSVPVSHSLLAFNKVAEDADHLSEEQISYFVSMGKVPPELISNINDESYGEKKPLFRRQSGDARVTIFDGGHEIIFEAALNWLNNQRREKY